MTGLDEILNVIQEKGRQSSAAIISAAEQKASKIRLDGEANAEKAGCEYIEKCRCECEKEFSAACSGAEAHSKRELLRCKNELIDKAVETALNKLSELSAEDYFLLILKLAGKNLRKGEVIIQFGKRDLERLPSDLEKNLNLLAAVEDSTIKISDEAADIDSGFIMSCGNISENCSFRAIAAAEREAVRDAAAKFLFSEVTA